MSDSERTKSKKRKHTFDSSSSDSDKGKSSIKKMSSSYDVKLKKRIKNWLAENQHVVSVYIYFIVKSKVFGEIYLQFDLFCVKDDFTALC